MAKATVKELTLQLTPKQRTQVAEVRGEDKKELNFVIVEVKPGPGRLAGNVIWLEL